MLTEDDILWEVVDEHLDEAEFLAEQWSAARRSPDYSLQELRDGPETRLLTHIDGLVLNGSVALERVAWPAMEGDDPTVVAVAALAILESGDFRVLDALDELDPDEQTDEQTDEDDKPPAPDPEDEIPAELEALSQEALAEATEIERKEQADADADELPAPLADARAPTPQLELVEETETDPRASGLALAISLTTHPKLGEQLRSRLRKAQGPTLVMLLSACADRGLDASPAIDHALVHDDLQVQCAALRAAPFSDRHRLLAAVEALLQHPTSSVRRAALDTGFLWGSRAAWQQALYAYKQPGGRSAMVWLACMGDDRHADALTPLLDDEALRHHALWALGFSGRVPAVEACLSWLDDDDETTRRLAAEAITAIVGLDLEDETLWEELAIEEPEPGIEGGEPDEDEDDLDAELAPLPEDDLPLPNADAIRTWWATHQSAFSPGSRYLLGKPLGKEGPGWALSQLSCRRVDVVAREIVARSQGLGRWPDRALAPRHLASAEALAELSRQAGSLRGGALS